MNIRPIYWPQWQTKAMPETVRSLLEWAMQVLTDNSTGFQSDSPRIDTEILLTHILGESRTYLLTWPEKKITSDQSAQFKSLVEKRSEGQPIAYLTEVWEFWSLPIKVNTSTLIPRPETERLVELALKKCTAKYADLADLGTGSGAIALALASERSSWSVLATDTSAQALEVARANAETLRLGNIEFLLSSWFSALPDKQFDLVISNPPYIDELDPALETSVINWEPRQALISSLKGMADLKIIINQAKPFLKAGAWLLVEHGYNQGEAVAHLFRQNGYEEINTEQDLSGQDRVTCGVWTGKS